MKLVWIPAHHAVKEQAVGALVRWREVGRGRWQYAYYRGREENHFGTYSITPNGPIVMWKLGPFGEVATVVTA